MLIVLTENLIKKIILAAMLSIFIMQSNAAITNNSLYTRIEVNHSLFTKGSS